MILKHSGDAHNLESPATRLPKLRIPLLLASSEHGRCQQRYG
ncbi:MAG: hypothetical protein AVDCRST_MAG93-944 [uncultured Chloroflexia bacterium]|uniref:Uncharacterized protein n=1 Tax=uncultured Chloroflexia bacterium TaxID=1672391 RepID=A0A6J4HTK9_9CHLR|nr:MAG: hypothetical protein AVDCRST_MAG93-944 [uncultured Chloroflexia bacterium]